MFISVNNDSSDEERVFFLRRSHFYLHCTFARFWILVMVVVAQLLDFSSFGCVRFG